MLRRGVAIFMHDRNKIVISLAYYITVQYYGGPVFCALSFSCNTRLLASSCPHVP